MESLKLNKRQRTNKQNLGPAINIPTKRLLALMQVSDDLVRTIFHLNQTEALQTIAAGIRKLLRAEACSIFLTSETDPGEIRLSASDADFKVPHLEEVTLKVASTLPVDLIGHIAKRGRIYRLEGKKLKKNPYVASSPACHLAGKPCYSLLGIPLKDRKGRILGVIEVDNKKSSSGEVDKQAGFDDTDEALARILVNKIGFVLENFRTFDAIRQLSQVMNNAKSSDEIIRKILAAGVGLLRAKRGDFVWWDSNKNQLVTGAQYGEGKLEEHEPLPKQSVVYEVWKTRQSALIRDVRTDKKFKSLYYEASPFTRSEVAVCLKIEGRPVGVLNIESDRINDFDVQDLELVQLLSQYAARATQTVEKEVHFRGIVQRLADESLQQSEVLIKILESVRGSYGFDASLIYIPDYTRESLYCAAWIGCDELKINPGQFVYKFSSRSLATKVYQERTGYFTSDPSKDPIVNQFGRRSFQINRPLVGIPLIFCNRIVGVLVSWSRYEQAPTKEHISLLAPFANLAALSIAASESAQQRTTILQKLRQILAHLQTEPSLEKKFDLILEAVQNAGFDKARVFEYMETNNTFVGRFSRGMKDPKNFLRQVISPEKNPYVKLTLETWAGNSIARRDHIGLYGSDPDARALEKNPDLPWATVPMVLAGKLYGYIAADNKSSKREITNDSLEYLTLLGTLGAQAMADAMELYTKAEAAKLAGHAKGLEESHIYLSHEFSHIISQVRSYAQRMKEDIRDPQRNHSALKDSVDIILGQTRLATRVGKLYLDYSKMLVPRFLQISAAMLITSATRSFGQVCSKRGIKIERKIPSDITIFVDSVMMIEVLRNVIQNAINAMPNGGTLTLEALKEGKQVVINIRDSGSGIKKKDSGKIFNLGFTTQPGKAGAGVGLALSSRIVREAHKGEIYIFNNPDGLGATVQIKLTAA